MTQLFPETIETDRLRMEAVRPETVDLFEFYEHAGDDPDIEEITEHLTWDPHATPKETLDFVEEMGEKYASGEGASYVIRPREGEEGAGEFAGDAGFGVDWDRRSMGLGTWLRKPFWGRGYSGERAAAMMALAFDRLDLELVAVTAHVDNAKSNRAIEKYVEAHGGRKEGLLRNWAVHDGEPADFYRYSVSREEWAANPADVGVRFVD
ncbi:GNAT family N-acetyltransferase [Halovivax sp.]|uniref:GNAT family N-acetyltransferase n=1 Tax=Halovivax sp. TaxID=1935978 RepID=UPI0025BFF7C7|nr:GNAT family protein [Halovivax sp.]